MSRPSQAAEARRPVRILVIQLARLGDTIQSLMALRAAKHLYPELEIHVVARKRFAAAMERISWIESVTSLDTDSLLGPILAEARSEREGLSELARWLSPLVGRTWDMVFNWTYSEASSYLTALLPARVKLGYSRRKDFSQSVTDGWSHYIQAMVQGDVSQNIHLTDVLTTQLLTALQIHAGDPIEENDAQVTSKSFFDLQPSVVDCLRDSTRKLIGIQLGAARASKAWSPESWAQVAGYVLERNPETSLVLLGGESEERLEARFLAVLGSARHNRPVRVHSLVGKTGFDAWATVVGRCQWLFAGDTAAIHLASVLGTRVLNVSVGPVKWTETGPYGNGHYIVSAAEGCEACGTDDPDPAAHSCHARVSPEAVYTAWSYASGEWLHRRQAALEAHSSQLGFKGDLSGTCVHRSRIRTPDEGGGVTYEPLIRRPIQAGEWMAQVMGHVARAWYCGWVPPIGSELRRDEVSPALVRFLRKLDQSAEVLAKICDEAKSTAARLHRRSSSLPSDRVMRVGDRDDLREMGHKLQELEKLMERVIAAEPSLSGFAHMSKVLMHNLSGAHLSDLGKETAESYRQLSQGVALVRDWVKHTLSLARPVAIEGAPVIPLKEMSP